MNHYEKQLEQDEAKQRERLKRWKLKKLLDEQRKRK